MSNESALEKARQRRRELKEQGEKLTKKNPIEKWEENKTSLRACINANCFECVGGEHDPGGRGRIRDCQIMNCKFHRVRPYQ